MTNEDILNVGEDLRLKRLKRTKPKMNTSIMDSTIEIVTSLNKAITHMQNNDNFDLNMLQNCFADISNYALVAIEKCENMKESK